MRTVIAFVVVAVIWLGAIPSARAQGNLIPKSGGAFTPPARQSGQLFTQMNKAREELQRRLQARAPVGPPTVVCGMTVIPADPTVDPKSIKKIPEDKKYRFTMRSVPPGICTQDSSNAPTVVVPPPTVAPR